MPAPVHQGRDEVPTGARHLGLPVVPAVVDDHQRPLPPGQHEERSADARRLRALFFQVHPGVARRRHPSLRRPSTKRDGAQHQPLSPMRVGRRHPQPIPPRSPPAPAPPRPNRHRGLARHRGEREPRRIRRSHPRRPGHRAQHRRCRLSVRRPENLPRHPPEVPRQERRPSATAAAMPGTRPC